MHTIGDLLQRDLTRNIVEIIQVDQNEEQPVYDEISEYVATDSIREQYRRLLAALAEAPAEPHENVGVWISGFFGSGKSSFAKYLGYALQNHTFNGQPFADLFKRQLDDQRVADLLGVINQQTPTDVILFEVAKEADTRKVTQRIAELMYTVLLRELDYAEDFDVAELEIELEAEGKLDRFVELCRGLYDQDWRKIRMGAQKISRASALLHQLDSATYTDADSWARSQRNRDAAITVSKVVRRTFELWGRRRPGKALMFVIDEVGQHVARSGDKIEDLRATVEEFGKVGRNLRKQRKIPGPCWVVVTAQEKLEEVVSALGDERRIELARLQDRFYHRVDLAPSDIREVATKRVLAKRPDAEAPLKKLFAQHQGSLNASLRLQRSTRRAAVDEADFVQFYPYPPHYIELCIGIMSGIRLQPGAPRQFGGSNRTIIKQAYEMLVSERTAMAGQPIGSLVTLDKVFELVEGNLSNERRTDIDEIRRRFQADADDRGWALRTAKVICLLEFVRDLPRIEANVAAMLVDAVDKPAPLAQVEAAVERLHSAQFIRNTEDGWKLLSKKEKSWEDERRGHLDPKPRERGEIARLALAQMLGQAEFKTYRHQNYRTFRVGYAVGPTRLGDEGELPLTLIVADEPDDLAGKLEQIREESRQPAHLDDVYWLFALSPEIDELVRQTHASKKMVEKYGLLRAQHKIASDEAACLQDEMGSQHGYEGRLRDKLAEAMERGTGMFRGKDKDAASLGTSLSEILKGLFVSAVPELYPKLPMGARPLKGDEAEQMLKTADLKALPSLFYAGDNGLALVIKDGAKSVVNPAAPVAQEALDYLKSEHNYGNKETRMGKALERRFTSAPYGWELDMLRLVLAALFRAGEVEVTHQGNRFANYQDAASRTPFTKTPAFRSSLFSPRQSVGLKTLTQAVQQLEDLTGDEVDVEEGAIAAAFKKVVAEELEKLYPVKALAEAHRLPVAPLLTEYQQTLSGIQSSASDDCVRILTETGALFAETREKVRKLREALTEKAVEVILRARLAVDQVWPRLTVHAPAPEVAATVDELNKLLASEQVVESLDAIQRATTTIFRAYRDAYLALFGARRAAYAQALEELKLRSEWQPLVPQQTDKEEDRIRKQATAETMLAGLSARLGTDEDRANVAAGKTLGEASLGQMESDLAAVDSLKASVVLKLQELSLSVEPRPIKRFRLAEFFDKPIRTQHELDAAVERLRSSLQKCIDEETVVILE